MLDDLQIKKITQDDIDKIDKFNVDLLKEAMRQAELKIQDENNKKNRIDTKAYALLTILISILGFILKDNMSYDANKMSIILLLTTFLIVCAIVCLLIVLISQKYCALGILPVVWMQKEFIQSYDDDIQNKTMFGHVLSHILFNTNKVLLISSESNEKRTKLLNKALIISILSLAPITLYNLCCYALSL